MSHQIFRIFRMMEYCGDRKFMETSLGRRQVKTAKILSGGYIKESLLGDWPEIVAEGLTEKQFRRRLEEEIKE